MPFDPLKLADHFNKHRADFQVSSDNDYEALADGFASRQRHPKLMECRRKMGDFIRYDGMTEEYAVLSGAGVIRTYFKPVPCASLPPSVPRPNCDNQVDNLTYFRKECAKR
jgi:pyocin large subunit-like protein